MNPSPRITIRDDRILPATRWILGLIIPVLLAAFVILFVFPSQTGRLFAWDIQPAMTAVLMGAGYLGGAYQFLYAVLGTQWHRVAPIFLPITTFILAMLLATLLHWDRFHHQSLAFFFWIVIYAVTPLLIPWVWLRNQITDPRSAEPNELRVAGWIRAGFGLIGVGVVAACLVSFVHPPTLIAIWPWKLTPLTARVIAGWGFLLGVGGWMLARETRWSSWRYGLQSIALWQGLVVIGSLLHQQDYGAAGLVNWYFGMTVLAIIGILILYGWMESKRIRQEANSSEESGKA
jgi:hypothetical protein